MWRAKGETVKAGEELIMNFTVNPCGKWAETDLP